MLKGVGYLTLLGEAGKPSNGVAVLPATRFGSFLDPLWVKSL